VSVIVPIYKVEKYIHRCIDSILNQTYTSLEIILVDDGSPDNCGKIIDKYKVKDNRIKVIHKKNGGLSDARNAGMKIASGEFIVFVDSDDWLEKNMIELMIQSNRYYRADIVQSAFFYAYENKRLIDNRYSSRKDESVLLNKKSLMFELVINEKVKNFAWGKLYKTELIKDIPFKEGVLFEDVFWAHQVMHRVNKFVIIHKPLYNYYQRNDSIVANYSSRNLDILKGLKERHLFLQQHYPELLNESYKMILKTSLIHYNLLLMSRKKESSYVHMKDIKTNIKKDLKHFKVAVREDKHLQMQLFLFSIHPYMHLFYLGIRKVLRKLNLLSQPVGLEHV